MKAGNRKSYRSPPGPGRGWRNSLAAVGIAVALAAVLLGLFKVAGSRLFSGKVYRVAVDSGVEAVFKARVDNYVETHSNFEYRGEDPEIIVAPEPRHGYNCSLIEGERPVILKAGDRTVTFKNDADCLLLYGERDEAVTDLEGFLTSRGDETRITMTAVGDIIPARTVARMMALHGVGYPFQRAAPHVNGADITCGDLECPISDRVKPPHEGVSFVAPGDTIEGIKQLGLDVASLANNHSTDFGGKVFEDTLRALETAGIEYVGGGRDRARARAPRFMDVKGVRFAFLGYNAIKGGFEATSGKPGVATVRLCPWYNDDPGDRRQVAGEISRAKKEADILVVFFHWGREYERQPCESVKEMAHLACDAGADLVIGGHPHCIQSVEYYRDRFIFYSLGNFVFDQMSGEKVRTGIIVNLELAGAEIKEAELVPYEIHDYCQPVIFEGNSGQHVLDEILWLSGL